MPEFPFDEPDEANALRHEDYEQWMRTVRDSADVAAEGVRIFQSKDGRSYALYEIALMPDGQWAIRLECRLRASSGIGLTWTLFETREKCLQYFQTKAAKHFGSERIIFTGQKIQQEVHHEMIDLLSNGLFGFTEPDVVR